MPRTQPGPGSAFQEVLGNLRSEAYLAKLDKDNATDEYKTDITSFLNQAKQRMHVRIPCVWPFGCWSQ